MFGNSKKVVNVNSEQIDAIIGAQTVITGDICSQGAIRIDGKVEGNLIKANNVIIGANGVVKSNITAVNAIIGGNIEGKIEVMEKIEILSTAKVIGNVNVGTLIINEGGIFRGNCEMKQLIEKSEAAATKKK